MTELLKDLSSQSEVVIKQLMINNNMQRTDALNTWYNSKTKSYLEANKLFYVSGMRCYWELTLELEQNPKWLRDPFDM